MPLTMPAAVIAVLAAPFGLDWLPFQLVGLGMGYVIAVADFVAGLGGAAVGVSSGPTVSLVLIALGGLFVALWIGRWRLLGLALFLYAAGLGALPLLSTLTQLWIFAALFGLSGGMITVLFFAVWRQAFGAAHLGRIQGAAQMLTVLASAIGPLIFAQCAAMTGSYTPALWTLAPCVFLLSLAAFRVPMPRPLPLPASSPV